ncbi:hypothetical protein EJ04DRAFT_566213 [Polyplosphaeria fusca]|uniref:Uncharacterized protein n=1 Tax=Polyplosphaeria fusca TaxID=682080 RepID=A0A9P4QVT7_9PLEO|nr:hypothetical protein EJ04DRAFT_566213 [Polyplosphaeria fusca]
MSPPLHQITKLQDLVYARLGLAENPRGIKVDTTKSVAEVYADASQFLLVAGFLEPLVAFKPYRFQQQAHRDSLPSWAYDWTEKELDIVNRYNAAGGTSQRVSITRYCNGCSKRVLYMTCPCIGTVGNGYSKRVLSMTGLSIGTVVIVNHKFSDHVLDSGLRSKMIMTDTLQAVRETVSREQTQQIVAEIRGVYQHFGLEGPGADIESLFTYHTISFGRFWCWWTHWVASLINMMDNAEVRSSNMNSPPPITNIAELLFRELPRSGANFPTTSGTRSGLLRLLDYRRVLPISGGQVPEDAVVDLADSLFRSAWGMRPAVLDTARVGYVPEGTEEGDEVVIFHGVKAPLVLRSATGGTYTIVGPTHVCGAMQGQLMSAGLSCVTWSIV